MSKERNELDPRNRALADYRRLLQHYAECGGRECIEAAFAASKVNPFELDSKLEAAKRHAACRTVKAVLGRLGTEAELIRPELLQIQREVLDGNALFPLHEELARLLTTFSSLNPAETAAFEQAALAIGSHFEDSHICFYDGYFDAETKLGPRRRDVAVVWDRFEGVPWSDRIASIKRVFAYPRFSVIGITPKEVEADEIRGVSSQVRTARKVDATRISQLTCELKGI